MARARGRELKRMKEGPEEECPAPLAQTNLHTFKILKHKAKGRQFIVKRERGQGMLAKLSALLKG